MIFLISKAIMKSIKLEKFYLMNQKFGLTLDFGRSEYIQTEVGIQQAIATDDDNNFNELNNDIDNEYIVEDVVDSIEDISTNIFLKIQVDDRMGEILLIENETKHLINKTKTFYFDSETEVELICTPISNDYELVEVVNSSNFSMNDSSVHHHIKVDGELEVHPIFRKKPKNQVNEVGHLRLNMNDGGVVRLS